MTDRARRAQRCRSASFLPRNLQPQLGTAHCTAVSPTCEPPPGSSLSAAAPFGRVASNIPPAQTHLSHLLHFLVLSQPDNISRIFFSCRRKTRPGRDAASEAEPSDRTAAVNINARQEITVCITAHSMVSAHMKLILLDWRPDWWRPRARRTGMRGNSSEKGSRQTQVGGRTRS